MQIGIDLGGTKTEAIALAADAVIASRRRVPTPREYDGTLETIARLVAELEAETGRSGTVGVGIPGVVTRATGLVKNANSVWLNGASCMPTWSPVSPDRSASPTTQTASPSPRPSTAPAAGTTPCSASSSAPVSAAAS